MAKRRGAPRWASLLSWIVGAVVWLWLINDLIMQDLPKTSILANAGAELLLEGLFFVAVATVLVLIPWHPQYLVKDHRITIRHQRKSPESIQMLIGIIQVLGGAESAPISGGLGPMCIGPMVT